ncbi:MAG: hypothetical protein P8Z00_19615, partial [Anaerolineales bacterium]
EAAARVRAPQQIKENDFAGFSPLRSAYQPSDYELCVGLLWTTALVYHGLLIFFAHDPDKTLRIEYPGATPLASIVNRANQPQLQPLC